MALRKASHFRASTQIKVTHAVSVDCPKAVLAARTRLLEYLEYLAPRLLRARHIDPSKDSSMKKR